MNARDELLAIVDWLQWQDAAVMAGLHCANDALRLHAYAKRRIDLPRFVDEWESEDRQSAIGYDPVKPTQHRKVRLECAKPTPNKGIDRRAQR